MNSAIAVAPAQTDMADTMDLDMDIDLGFDDIDHAEAEAEAEAMNLELQAGPSSPSEAGEINEEEEAIKLQGADIAPEKVHVRGLDNLTTDDIYAFAADHFPQQRPSKIEWIDDTSANIVYPSTTTAGGALRAFTSPTTSYPEDPLEIRPAKAPLSIPSLSLSIRLALLSDKKAPRAGDASRFYLLNPDKDPREQRRRTFDTRRRGPPAEGPRKRRRDDDEDDTLPFHEDMYDDDPTSLASRITRPLTEPRRRRSSDRDLFANRDRRDRSREEPRHKRTRRDRSADLFASRARASAPKDSEETYGRLRDRSASPLRDGDGRHGFAENAANTYTLPSETSNSLARRIRSRSQTPPRARIGRNVNGNGNAEKELFADSSTMRSVLQTPNGSKELFPRGTPGSKSKPRSSGHQRTDAVDAKEGRDLFARLNGGRSLEERISGAPGSGGETGRSEKGAAAGGFNIRGSAMEVEGDENPGFSIRGLGANHKRVKELFPDRVEEKAGNKDRDLFAGRLAGRGVGGGGLEGRITGRRRAEDLFL